MKKKKGLEIVWRSILPLFALVFIFTCCKDDDNNRNKVAYNPAEPVTITRFTPDTGRVATQMLIYGTNFGSDKSKIGVTVDGKKAALIGVNDEGTILYVIVPSLLREGEAAEDGTKITASVKVDVGFGSEMQSVTPDNQFGYTFTRNVSTFLGFTDKDGLSAIVDGAFEKAQFNEPFWLAYDEDKNVYLIEENNGLRFIDMERREVSTIFRTGNGVGRPRTIAFTLDYDTMLIANDVGEWDQIGTIALFRDPHTRRYSGTWKTMATHKQCNGGAIHPYSGSYFFNSYEQSQVYKMRRTASVPWGREELFLVQDRDWEFNIQFAPSGRFAYIVAKNQHYIAKSEYDPVKDVLLKPVPFVGTKQRSGYLDGVGLNTLFDNPHQGAFDEDDNYYLCDGMNHCIRKITPEGQVTTFAGRPDNYGYSDGALRDAQFDRPYGIIYNDEIRKFYIADQKNRRIRTISVE